LGAYIMKKTADKKKMALPGGNEKERKKEEAGIEKDAQGRYQECFRPTRDKNRGGEKDKS